jgi:hypothetical protein
LLPVRPVGVWHPVVAAAAIQIGVSIAVEIHAVCVPPMASFETVRVHCRYNPEADIQGYLIGMGAKMI